MGPVAPFTPGDPCVREGTKVAGAELEASYNPAGKTHPDRSWKPSDRHHLAPVSPVPAAGTLWNTAGPMPMEAEAHLGTLLSSGARWSPRSRKSLQMEAQLVNPYPRMALSPAILLQDSGRRT